MFNSDQKIKLPKYIAYKLNVSVSPHWPVIIDKIAGSKDSNEVEELWAKYEKNADKIGDALFGRTYAFTEYYDMASGLTSRFQTIRKETAHCFPVDEFLDYGYIFGTNFDPRATREDRDQKNKWSLEIKEDSIRNKCFDEYVGGYSPVGSKEDYLSLFPVDSILRFLLEVGLHFHDLETHTVIKWPDSIEEQLKKNGFKYDALFDNNPPLFDIEKQDNHFFEKNGRPQISSSLSGRSYPIFTSDVAEFRVSVKMFRPNNNDRLPWVAD